MIESELLNVLFWSSIKTVILIALAIGVMNLVRSLSAASRHSIWFNVFLASLVLPVMSGILPSLQIPVLSTSLAGKADTTWITSGSSIDPSIRPVGRALDPPMSSHIAEWAQGVPLEDILVATYLLGVMVLLGSFVRSLLAVRRLEGTARVADEPALLELKEELCELAEVRRQVRLLTSPSTDTPLTWGLLRPRIMLPDSALEWPRHQLRSALLHELAHIRRCDWLGLWLAQIVLALQWFNPFIWHAFRRWTLETEKACDDVVLRCGSRSSDYAEQLIELMESRRHGGFAGAGIALGETQLSARVLAILNSTSRRYPMKATHILVSSAAVFVAASILAACQVTSAAQNDATAPNPPGVAASPPAAPPSPAVVEQPPAFPHPDEDLELQRRQLDEQARLIDEQRELMERELTQYHEEMERLAREMESQQAELEKQVELERQQIELELAELSEQMEAERRQIEQERATLEQLHEELERERQLLEEELERIELENTPT